MHVHGALFTAPSQGKASLKFSVNLLQDGTVSPLSVHLGLGRLQYCTSQQDSDPQGEIPASSITAGEPNTAPDIQQLQPDPVAAEAREFIHTQSRHRKWRDRPPGHQQDQDRAPDTNANEFGTKAGPNRYLGKAPLIAWPARITGVGRRTTARDILRALAGFDLQEGQVRYCSPSLPTHCQHGTSRVLTCQSCQPHKCL